MQKGNCQACHGWSGDGRKTDNQIPDGANLRETKLDRATFVMIVKCGLPGTGMPPFDRLAYSDGRCCGEKEADLRAQGIRDGRPAGDIAAARSRPARRFCVPENRRRRRDGAARSAPITAAARAEVCNEIK